MNSKKIGLAGVCILMGSILSFGQLIGPWVPAQNLKKRSQEEWIKVANEKDAKQLLANPSLLSDAYSLMIENQKAPSGVLELLTQWQDVSELYLKNSGQELSKDFLNRLTHIDHVILECSPDDSALLVNIASLPSLQQITLIFKQSPENWDFLFYYQKIKKLHIYGSFLPQDFHLIGEKLMVYRELREFGLSVDFATDLPRNLNLLPNLKTLKLYDNHSRINHQNRLSVSPEQFNIAGILGNDQPILFSVLFYSQDYGLTYRENKYLEQIWMGRRLGYEPQDESPAIRGRKDMYTLAPKPLFVQPEGLDVFLQGLYPESEVFSINPDENNILHTKRGMNIYLPAGAILNQNQKSYTGTAFISIRYLNNLLDMAFRGMDLKVTKFQNSPNYHADLGFEIQVSDGVFPLQFNGVVNIKVELPYKDTASALYFYDTESKGFLDYEMFKMIYQDPDQKIVPIRYDEWLRKDDLANRSYFLDERDFEERFKDPESFFLLDQEAKSEKFVKRGKYFTGKVLSWTKSDVNPKNIRTVKEGRRLYSVKRHTVKRTSKNDLYFAIQQQTDLFNELNVFKKRVFKYADTLDRKEFSSAFIRGINYSDFRLNVNSQTLKWEFILKTDLGYKIIQTEAALFKRNGKQLSEKRTQKAIRKFRKIQNERRNSFNSFLDERRESYSSFYNKRQNDWDKKGQYKTVFIQHTGLYNMMHIQEKDESLIDLHLSYLTPGGLPLDVKELVVIEKSTGNVRKINKGNVKLNLETTSLLLCMDYQNNLYWLDGESLRNSGLTDGGIFFIKLNSTGFSPRNIDEFRKYIRFDKLK